MNAHITHVYGPVLSRTTLQALSAAVSAKSSTIEVSTPAVASALVDIKDAINYPNDGAVGILSLCSLLLLGLFARLLAWPTRGLSLACAAAIAGPLCLSVYPLAHLGPLRLFDIVNRYGRPLEVRQDPAGLTAILRRNPPPA